MFTIHKKEIDWCGKKLTIETGQIARQADGAVMVTYGETKILATAVGAKKVNPDIDFFPLTVHYQEKTFAAGKIPGGFFKREGRPSEFETLTSRLIDRPIRPLFPKEFKNEVQVIVTTLTHDLENSPDIPALIGASAALAVSGMPFLGPIGATRLGRIDGKLVFNPTLAECKESDLDLVVAGTKEGVLMVESQAQELSEKEMLSAVMDGWKAFQPVIKMIESLAKDVGKTAWAKPEAHPQYADVKKTITKLAEKQLQDAYKEVVKQNRQEKIAAAKNAVNEHFASQDDVSAVLVGSIFKELEADIVRGQILKTGGRIDGRDTKTVRQIEAQVGILPRTHGSALFTRGETQALVVATLGTGTDEQMIDALEGEYREDFMLHYNFPPYSVGECGRMGTGRREVGHGKLAWRAIKPMLPKEKESFPYTIRVVSEITESNGSSSMATVCGTSLSLMDAGVPLTRPVAGIAMGLIKEGKDFAVLSDILGDEDHLGDMDFKVAGTDKGITSLQMDIKITSITEEIMKIALEQAKDGRLHILGEMKKALDAPRGDVSQFAPTIVAFQIDKEKIRDVIGTGGKVIREIVEQTGAKIDIEDDGTVRVAAVNRDALDAAVAWIKDLTEEPELGTIYEGEVRKIVDFGAFVNFVGNYDGLVHISEIKNERVNQVTDHLKEGEIVWVKLIGTDPRGKFRLSMRVVDQETGEELEDTRAASNADTHDADEDGEKRDRRPHNKKKA